jgi:hypothetical protein
VGFGAGRAAILFDAGAAGRAALPLAEAAFLVGAVFLTGALRAGAFFAVAGIFVIVGFFFAVAALPLVGADLAVDRVRKAPAAVFFEVFLTAGFFTGTPCHGPRPSVARHVAKGAAVFGRRGL